MESEHHERIGYDFVETALGRLALAVTGSGLCYLGMGSNAVLESVLAWRQRWSPGSPVVRDAAAIKGAGRQLVSYACGDLRRFDLSLDLRGSSFQLECWRKLIEISYGSTMTYAQLARGVGRGPSCARAVGQANAANPVPIIVPCHRVLAADGLGGYSGGLELKARLLELEGITLPLG